MNDEVQKQTSLVSAYSLDREALIAIVTEVGGETWRADQVFTWLYHGRASCWADMTNLPAVLRAALSERLRDLDGTAHVEETAVEGGGTNKLLLRLYDGERIETVIIPARNRNTVCVSSQVGCAFNCAFCASGLHGVVRSLEAGEIVAQVVRVAEKLGTRPDNVVFMGIGEPFANYDAVLQAARILNDPDALGIGARKITFSTCGVVPGIERLAEEGVQFELSVSLHAPTQALRETIMPVAAKWPLGVLMETCRAYTERTNRIITFEYTLIDGFNNLPVHAQQLVKLLRGLKCRVNLIPLNPVPEFDGRAPVVADSEAFYAIWSEQGLIPRFGVQRGVVLMPVVVSCAIGGCVRRATDRLGEELTRRARRARKGIHHD